MPLRAKRAALFCVACAIECTVGTPEKHGVTPVICAPVTLIPSPLMFIRRHHHLNQIFSPIWLFFMVSTDTSMWWYEAENVRGCVFVPFATLVRTPWFPCFFFLNSNILGTVLHNSNPQIPLKEYICMRTLLLVQSNGSYLCCFHINRRQPTDVVGTGDITVIDTAMTWTWWRNYIIFFLLDHHL